MKNSLTTKQVAELKSEHKVCKNKKHADRLKCILMLNTGYTFAQCAEILLMDDSTLRNYYRDYTTGGINFLLHDDHKGSQGFLTEEQKTQVEKNVDENIYLSTKEVVKYIKDVHNIEYSCAGACRLLHELGFVYKKPKHIPCKANLQDQQDFIEAYFTLKNSKNTEDKIYFMDGTHPMHNSQLNNGWIKKGTDKYIKSNTGRTRVNINGAYNIETHELVARTDKTINAQSTILLLDEMQEKQKS